MVIMIMEYDEDDRYVDNLKMIVMLLIREDGDNR